MKCGVCGVKLNGHQTCCDFCGATFAPDINTVSPNEVPRGRVTENDIGGHKHTKTGCDTYGRPRQSTPKPRLNNQPPPRTSYFQTISNPTKRKPPMKRKAKFFQAIPILIFLVIFGIIVYSIISNLPKKPEPHDPFDERTNITDFITEYLPPNTLNFSVIITNNTSDIISVSIHIQIYENENYTGGFTYPFQNILPNQTVTRAGSYAHYATSYTSTFKITGWTVFPVD